MLSRRWFPRVLLAMATLLECVASFDIIDATGSFQKSSESLFDHEVTILSEDSEKLVFHWNDIKGNTIECRLIHWATSIDVAPSWIGFGIYDTFRYTEPISSEIPFMERSDAIVGLVSSGSVFKYDADNVTSEGLKVSEHQTLHNSGLEQHFADDGTVTTALSFEKMLEESSSEEARIRHVGDNVFLWSLGPHDQQGLAFKEWAGAFTLDLTKVQETAEASGAVEIGEGVDANEEAVIGGNDAVPVVVGRCQSAYDETDMMVELTPTLNFHWKLNLDESPPTITAIVEYIGEAWVGLGFSKTGKMIGSTAVIGLPDSTEAPLKYDLTDRTVSSVVPSSSQSLLRTNVTQEHGKTILTFTKVLEEGDNEAVLSPDGLNTFLFAIGTENTLSYHEHRGSFGLNLSTCSSQTTSSNSKMGIWIAHGILAVIAWAVASPFAITVAWFRTLVPSSWIYIHVFANVISYAFSLTAVIVAVVAMSSDSFPSHFSKPHHWVGLALIVAMTFQVMNGFLRPPVEKRDPYSSAHYSSDSSWLRFPRTSREIWFATHRLSGLILLAMGIYQVQSGLHLFATRFNVNIMGYWSLVYYGIFGSCLLLLKLWIMFEEYKARKGMAAISAVDNQGVGHDESNLVQYDS